MLTGGDLFDIAAKLGEPGYDREQQAGLRRSNCKGQVGSKVLSFECFI